MSATPDEREARRLRRERFARDAAVFVPRRLVADDGSVDLLEFMAEVNAIVATRGMVLADGQVISTPFSDGIGYELFGDTRGQEHRRGHGRPYGRFVPPRSDGCTVGIYVHIPPRDEPAIILGLRGSR